LVSKHWSHQGQYILNVQPWWQIKDKWTGLVGRQCNG
jgi:hypothetical protein